MVEGILAFIVVFAIIVFIHELGHFIFAKRAGILVREFSIGFGPKLFFYRKGETAYTIRILPLGGYVMMAGYEEEEDLRPGMVVNLVLDNDKLVEKIQVDSSDYHITNVPLEVTDFDLVDDLFIEGNIDGNPDERKRFELNRTATVESDSGVDLQIAPRDRRFQNASLIDRILTNFAGPLNNFILSIVAFTILGFLMGGVPLDEPVIGEIVPSSPADHASLEEGDRITKINNEEVSTWTEMQEIIQHNPDKELAFQVEGHDGQEESVQITPSANQVNEELTVGQIGVGASRNSSPLSIIGFGFASTWGVIVEIVSLMSTIFTGGFTINNLGGPVAIFAVSEQVVKSGGLLALLSFLASLSTNLGLVNLLPIPGLDGGKLLLNFIEGIRGKPISEEKETILTLIGAGFLLILMIAVTWKDIQTFFF